MNSRNWETLSETYAFLGNSLLLPMSQTLDVGIDPAFWESLPDFGSEEVRAAVNACAAWARRALASGEDAAVQEASVEHTRLFVGPPRPAAAPWETFYRGDGEVSVGFGQATAEMRALLREAGLEMSGPSNQYADHMGIELLLLSELCRRAGEAAAGCAYCDDYYEDDAAEADTAEMHELSELEESARSFAREHPLSWVDKLYDAVESAAPQGYIACLVNLVRAILAWHVNVSCEYARGRATPGHLVP